jgi:hypothetical protein
MGVDPRLDGRFPWVTIHGERFYYGKDPEYDSWLVSHPSEGKRYWHFETEQAMLDFLENLPESAEPPTVQGLPIFQWHGLIPQAEYDRLWAAHRERLARLLDDKRATGATYSLASARSDD